MSESAKHYTGTKSDAVKKAEIVVQIYFSSSNPTLVDKFIFNIIKLIHLKWDIGKIKELNATVLQLFYFWVI